MAQRKPSRYFFPVGDSLGRNCRSMHGCLVNQYDSSAAGLDIKLSGRALDPTAVGVPDNGLATAGDDAPGGCKAKAVGSASNIGAAALEIDPAQSALAP